MSLVENNISKYSHPSHDELDNMENAIYIEKINIDDFVCYTKNNNLSPLSLRKSSSQIKFWKETVEKIIYENKDIQNIHLLIMSVFTFFISVTLFCLGMYFLYNKENNDFYE